MLLTLVVTTITGKYQSNSVGFGTETPHTSQKTDNFTQA